jgi:predicted kinase
LTARNESKWPAPLAEIRIGEPAGSVLGTSESLLLCYTYLHMNTKKIFILRGSPSSGKGTIIKEFMKKIPGKVVYLEEDKFRWGFHLINRSVPDISDDEHFLAYKNYLSVLENYLGNGTYTIVTEGLFSWTMAGPHGCMQDILKLCQKYDFDTHPILLYSDYKTLWERNCKREYSVPEEEFKMLYSYVNDEQSQDEIKIDVGINSVESSVEILTTYL